MLEASRNMSGPRPVSQAVKAHPGQTLTKAPTQHRNSQPATRAAMVQLQFPTASNSFQQLLTASNSSRSTITLTNNRRPATWRQLRQHCCGAASQDHMGLLLQHNRPSREGLAAARAAGCSHLGACLQYRRLCCPHRHSSLHHEKRVQPVPNQAQLWLLPMAQQPRCPTLRVHGASHVAHPVAAAATEGPIGSASLCFSQHALLR